MSSVYVCTFYYIMFTGKNYIILNILCWLHGEMKMYSTETEKRNQKKLFMHRLLTQYREKNIREFFLKSFPCR